MKFGIIAELANRYQVKALCQMLQVSRSGYYSWSRRGRYRREQENEQLLDQVRTVNKNSPDI